MSPRPAMPHVFALAELEAALRAHRPSGWYVLPEPEVDLCLVGPGQPGTARVPDLAVVDEGALRRVRREGGLVRAAEVSLVVEIMSPSSRRIDQVLKRAEYAEAGIPHYWIVDLTPPVSIVMCHLAGDFGYQDPGAMAGRVSVTEPFEIQLDLDDLRLPE